MQAGIITISREFGSGGRVIGERLAEALGLPCYDRSIIEQAAKESGLSEAFIEEEEQRFDNSMLFSLSMGNAPLAAGGLDLPGRVFEAESAVIRKLAGQGGCVMVGRCADYLLREYPALLSVFICGDFDKRVKRAVEVYGLPPEKAARTVRARDKQRARHYHFYTDRTWGGREWYDMTLNSSRLGMDVCVDLLAAAARRTFG